MFEFIIILSSFIESVSMCESVIDEHFRRSLGADYMEIFKNINNKTLKSDSPLASPTLSEPLEMTLDLKKSPPSTPQPMEDETDATEMNNENCENIESGGTKNEKQFKKESVEFSVDDHFAKALGDTWKKIKANNEKPPQSLNLSSNSSTSSCDSNNRSNSNSPNGNNNSNKKDSLRPCINQLV